MRNGEPRPPTPLPSRPVLHHPPAPPMPSSHRIGLFHPQPSPTRNLVSTPGPAHLPPVVYPTPTHTPSTVPAVYPVAAAGLTHPQLMPTPSVAMVVRPAVSPGPARLALTPAPFVAPVPPPEPPQMLPVQPPPYHRPTGDPTKHGSWPPKWRTFLELARTFSLSDLLFVHGFPSTFVLRNQAGESLTYAWAVYHRKNPLDPLNRSVCESPFPHNCLTDDDGKYLSVDDYRDSLRNIVSIQ